MLRIGLLTYSGAPQLAADDRLVITPLRELGLDGVPVIWDRAPTDLSALVVRSCWDYTDRLEAWWRAG